MNYKKYIVKGLNPETNRKNTVKIDVPNSRDVRMEVLKLGKIIEPFEIEQVPFAEPTKEQINYAGELKLKIPDGACSEEVSDIISRKVNDYKKAPKELMQFAESRGVCHSQHISEEELIGKIICTFSEIDELAFYCLQVFRRISGEKSWNLDESPHRSAFYSFAESNISNELFRYCEIEPSEAYFTVAEYLYEALHIPIKVYFIGEKSGTKGRNTRVNILSYWQAKKMGYLKSDKRSGEHFEAFLDLSEAVEHIVDNTAYEYDSYYDHERATEKLLRQQLTEILLKVDHSETAEYSLEICVPESDYNSTCAPLVAYIALHPRPAYPPQYTYPPQQNAYSSPPVHPPPPTYPPPPPVYPPQPVYPQQFSYAPQPPPQKEGLGKKLFGGILKRSK